MTQYHGMVGKLQASSTSVVPGKFLPILMGEMGSWRGVYLQGICVRDARLAVFPLHPSSLAPNPGLGHRKPRGRPGGGRGPPSGFPRKEGPGGSCDRMRSEAPSPAAGDFLGRARLAGRLLLRGCIELPLRVWGSDSPRPTGELWVRPRSGWR